MLNDELSEQVRQEYLRLIDKLRAQLSTRKTTKVNRQQRRAQARLGEVNLSDITFPWQMTTALCATMAHDRIGMNYQETGHPYHHLTATNVIVEPDPTLEYYLKRLEKEDPALFATLKVKVDTLIASATTAPKAIPVNRKFYGHDPYERH